MIDDLWRQTAVSLARLICAKEVTAREVVESHLTRRCALS